MESHIQLPCSVLKRFVERKKGILYAYDLKENKIIESSAKQFGKEENYFDEEIEGFLRNNFETPYGDVRKNLHNWFSGKDPELLIKSETVQTIALYLESLFYRNKKILSDINKIYNTDISPSALVSLLETNKNTIITPDKFSWSVYQAETDIMIPFAGFIIFTYKQEMQYILPLAPNYGFIFYRPEINEPDTYKYHNVNFNKTVCERVNRDALRTERAFGDNFVISNNKELLEKILLK